MNEARSFYLKVHGERKVTLDVHFLSADLFPGLLGVAEG